MKLPRVLVGLVATTLVGLVLLPLVHVRRLENLPFNERTPVTSLRPGELPGYTGWARPEYTLAGAFRVVRASSKDAFAGREWYVDIACTLPECKDGGAEFYLRAYGPSVISGLVEDNADGTYRMSFHPFDEGLYTVEVVLAFSNAPSIDDFPLGEDSALVEPGYEGYLLAEFPMQLRVMSVSSALNRNNVNDLPWCNTNHLSGVENSAVIRQGRWVVADQVRDYNHKNRTRDANKVSLEGYQYGYNSLGVLMEYIPTDCRLVDHQQIAAEDDGILNRCIGGSGGGNHVHVIFIGDSVMALEWRAFKEFLQAANLSTSNSGRISTSFVGTFGGLARQLDTVIETLEEMKEKDPEQKRLIIFNSGLHDIAQLCSVKYVTARREYLDFADGEFSCVEMYKSLLHDLVSFLFDYPADLLAFRTTSAGWLPYGNMGFAWNPNVYQTYSLSPNFAAHMNEIAKDVVTAIDDKILVLDGYYITLPRPDHREVDKENAIGKHLVHPGPQVVNAVANIWFNVVLRTLCGDVLDDKRSMSNVEKLAVDMAQPWVVP